MGFLSGSVTFQCFRTAGDLPRQFTKEHIEALESFGIGKSGVSLTDQADVGFIAGQHLFDVDFDLEKNVIGDALHCGIRVDSAQVPSAVRKAWLQMELSAIMAENPDRRPTKLQRQEAKEAAEARCEEELAAGKYRRMQPFAFLWDLKEGLLYFGATSATASEHCCDLLFRAFEIECDRLTTSRRAHEWAADAKQRKALEAIMPSSFLGPDAPAEIAWWNTEADNYDFLGNEFLLWLWWHFESQGDTIKLPDETEVTGMMARSLSLECPLGESGKESISAENPAQLPEARQAIRTGKLPRKAGLTLVRQGEQYEFALQAETFAISGARIHAEEESDGNPYEDRIESLRGLQTTADQLFRAFLQRRVGKAWTADLEAIRRWLKGEGKRK